MSIRYFAHIHRPAPGASRRTLLLLHGPAGDEHELIPFASSLQPTAGLLSPRGQLTDGERCRYFRWLPAGICDLGDLERRAGQLANFVAEAAERYHFDPNEVVAVGFSEGATLASMLMMGWPQTLAGAVLLRGAPPAMPDRMPKLGGRPVLVANGRYDPVVQPADTRVLEGLLRAAGADVTVAWQPAAQQIVHADTEQARAWFSAYERLRSPLRTS